MWNCAPLASGLHNPFPVRVFFSGSPPSVLTGKIARRPLSKAASLHVFLYQSSLQGLISHTHPKAVGSWRFSLNFFPPPVSRRPFCFKLGNLSAKKPAFFFLHSFWLCLSSPPPLVSTTQLSSCMHTLSTASAFAEWLTLWEDGSPGVTQSLRLNLGSRTWIKRFCLRFH